MIPKTQIFGATAAAFSGIIATFTCRAPKMPSAGYYGDFGVIVPLEATEGGIAFFIEFNNLIHVQLEE